MTDPCKKGTSVKILRNVVKIKTGRKTKLTKKNICEVYTNIQEGKLLLPPLVLTPDRTYLLDKKSPFNSNDYEKLFDRSSSRVTLKKLAEKINIKKVDALTKKQLTDTILKRLQFLNISEPVKLSKRSSVAAVKCPIAAKRPTAVQSTAVKRTVQKRPAAVQSTAAKVATIFKGPNVPEKPLVPEQAKVVLGNRNYDLLFDPKTKREELLRIANKVGVENTENMTKKELIEATTKRVRFMSNRGLTPKNIKSGAKVPFFPKPPNRPPPTTTPAFLQQKSGSAGGPPVGGPPGGTPNFLKGRTVVPVPPRPPNAKPNNAKPNNVKPNAKPNNVKPNNVKPSTTNTGTGNNNVKPSTTNTGTGNNNVKPSTTNTGTGNNNVRPNNGIGKNTLPPNVKPSTTNIGTGNNKVKPNSGNAPPPKKSGKSFFNYFRGGKKKNATATATANAPPKKSGKGFFNYFKGGKKKNATAPTKKGKSFFNYFKGGKKKNVNVKPNNGIGKNTLPPNVKPNNVKPNNGTLPPNNVKPGTTNTGTGNNNVRPNNGTLPPNVKPNKIENNKINNMTEELITRAVNDEIVNSMRKNIKNAINKKNVVKINNMTEELITNAVNEELNKEISNSKPNNNFNATNERNKQVVNNMTDELITRAVNNEIVNSMRKNIKNTINKKNVSRNTINKKNVSKNSVNTINNKNTSKNSVKNKKIEVNSNQLINEIINKLTNDISTDINKVKLNSNKPIYNNSSNSNNNNNKKPIYNNSSNNNNNNNKKTAQNNPLFEPNMTNNPIFNNKKSGSNELSKHINNLGLPNANRKKLMNLFNTTNQTLEAAKRNANTLSNTRKLQNKNSFNGGLRLGANNNNVSLPPSNNAVNVNNVKVNVKNFNSERNKLKNKITKELNMIPNNDGKFQERKGFTKGRIGLWARELRAAKSIGDLDAIENALNKKVELRRNIENKYTKAGLTKVEKMNHRRRVVKFVNNVDERRKLIETQVKNKNNNSNKNSVISNYNSNANNNPNRAKKMKYKSRENFVDAKKIELRELAKKTSTNFGRNIDRMQTRQNVFKLRGRIKGAIRRDEALSRL